MNPKWTTDSMPYSKQLRGVQCDCCCRNHNTMEFLAIMPTFDQPNYNLVPLAIQLFESEQMTRLYIKYRILLPLPVTYTSQYKILMYTFNALQGTAPQYLEEIVVPYQPTRSLRSESGAFLVVPTTRGVTYGNRCFRKVAATLWNNLQKLQDPWFLQKEDNY